MEIEKENISIPQTTISTSNKVSTSSLIENQINYISQILGIKINKDELALFSDIEDISSFINTIKFPDKKKNETKDTIIEELQSLKNEESFKKISEEKSKKFSEVVKTNGKTTVYHTAEKDELSPTMHAYYFCDKSKLIYSDKQEAEIKIMALDPVCPPFIKEEDNSSYNSNINENQLDTNNNKNLGKKRKPSNSFNNKQKPPKKKKTEKNNNLEHINNNAKNKNNESEAEYCTEDCKIGRKNKHVDMIQCEGCDVWYHIKCVGVSNEEFKSYVGTGKKYYCPDCEDRGIESKKSSEA